MFIKQIPKVYQENIKSIPNNIKSKPSEYQKYTKEISKVYQENIKIIAYDYQKNT